MGLITQLVDFVSAEEEQGGIAAVQVVGDLHVQGRDKIGKLPEGHTAGLLGRSGTAYDLVVQVIYLADADPLTGIHPGHIDPAISAAEVIHGTAVFHQDRTEGKGVQHAFSVDMCRDRSFLGLVDAGEIAIFINQEYVHEQCVPLADGFQIVFVQGPLADDVSQTAFFSAAEVVAVDGEYGIGAFR